MIIEIGHFSLLLSFLLSFLTIMVAIFGTTYQWHNWERLACSLAPVTFFLISISFSALIYGFIVSDFSLTLVFENSHSSKPLLYSSKYASTAHITNKISTLRGYEFDPDTDTFQASNEIIEGVG